MAGMLTYLVACGARTGIEANASGASAADGAGADGPTMVTEGSPTEPDASEDATDEADAAAETDGGFGSACLAEGGECYGGIRHCAYPGPQDCAPGTLCCRQHVTYPDGSGADPQECIKAGGRCVAPPSLPCAVMGPQSCGPQNIDSPFCCFDPQ